MVIGNSMVATQTWRESGDFFEYRGHSIFFRDSGQDKPVLLCIHGFPSASWDWHKLWPTLTQTYRLVMLDMIGFGFSAKPKNYDYSILDQADLHLAFVEHLRIRQLHILAHDYGDTVTQELLARALGPTSIQKQAEVLSVCLLNGGLFPETHRPRFVQKLLKSPIGGLVARLTSKASLAKSLSAIFGPSTQLSEQELDALWQLLDHNHGQAVMHKLIRYMDERVRYRQRWLKALQDSTMPIRLIDGMYDPVSGEHMVRRYRELVSQPDVVELTNIGHYPQVEAPKKVLEAFLEFQTQRV